MRNFWSKIAVGLTLLVSVVGFAPAALAEDCIVDTNTDPLGLACVKGSTLTNNDPRIIATRVINVVLGLLGTIATVLIFYAGFLWMTAAGDDDQIGKSKSIMSAAVIGLVVILASYSIANFFVKSAQQAVNGSTTVTQ